MRWSIILVLLSLLTAGDMINKPVYKIVLTQKGYAQFLQYDIETPPLREFTFCTWIRVYDLGREQSIFTYVANGSSRIVRLWLDAGGANVKVSINGKVTSTSAVDMIKDVWRHICLSYQSDFGAWALYIDARLVSCEAALSLSGYTLPRGGSVIIGYGTADNGTQNGFEGEIFGANMILVSTIERNYTAKNDPEQEQKSFKQNKIKNNNNMNSYVILNDLQTDEIHNNFENTEQPFFVHARKLNKSFIKFQTLYDKKEDDVGSELIPKRPKIEKPSKAILDALVTYKTPITDRPISFWTLENETKEGDLFESNRGIAKFDSKHLESKNLPLISEYETPPPVNDFNKKYFTETFETKKYSTSSPILKNEDIDKNIPKKSFNTNIYKNEITEVETPPPLQKNTKVYGQWTSSHFAGNVLNYLKSFDFYKRQLKKTPPTIPLLKLSESFPYASELKLTKIRPPSLFQRRNFIEKRYDSIKINPQINVQILQEDLRNNIIKSHARTRPKQVQIFNRGDPIKHDKRFYRHINKQDTRENIDSVETIFQTTVASLPIKQKHFSDINLQNNNLLSVLSFLKAMKYTIEDSTDTESNILDNGNDMYSNSLSKGNKWHNVKSYNNDYTPRHINMDVDTEMEHTINNFNKNIPSIRLNYRHKNYELGKAGDANIIKARDLAMDVSNQSNSNTGTISILKYNHGFLPTNDNKGKISDKLNDFLSSNFNSSLKSESNFNKHIKIGNALNERLVIGTNEKQRKVSFVGGDETIPDINRYRSELAPGDGIVPASLGPRVCKNVELYDRVLYVQPDESIDMTHILSPIRVKNLGIEFIIQNYKKCTLTESLLEKSDILYINWSKTPVRLFGGAYPRTTTDLCGFF